MKRWEISAVQEGMLIAGVVALSGHALAVTHFMRAGGRDAWMSGFVALPAAAVAIASWYGLRRIFPDDTLVQFMPKILGVAGYPVAALYLLYYFTVVVFTLRTTTDWMIDSILPETPTWVMSSLYMAAVLYPAMGGLDVLARVNQFVLPLLCAFGLVVSISTIPVKDYRLLTPFFEHGLSPILAASFLAMGYYGETSVAAMSGAYVRKDEHRKLLKAYFFALLFLMTTFTGPLAGSMATLGYRVAQNMPYPTFQHWLMVSYAKFFERTDLIAVHQWLAGAYVRCAHFLLMGAVGGCQLVKTKRAKLKWVLPAVGAAIVAVSELAFKHKALFAEFVIGTYLPLGAYLGVLLPPVLYGIARVRGLHKQRQGTQTYGG